jgi:UDP-N-acetylmuramoylalanine--D-glutamate ligase
MTERQSDLYYVHNKTVAVVGLGMSGVAAAKLLVVRGAQVVIVDDKTPDKLAEPLAALKGLPVSLVLGGITPEVLAPCDLVVVSPGIRFNHPALEAARAKGVQVIGELELAYAYCSARVLAITGTNGKTTTTALAEKLVASGGAKALACGNIGRAFAEAVFELSAEDWAVVEVSSFQLETIVKFRPQVAALLNITPDHLDRHGSMQAYVEAKARLFENQGPEDAAILNVRDKYTPLIASMLKSKAYGFGFPQESKALDKPGCYVVDGQIELLGRKILPVTALRIPGPHNQENACAAALAASLAGVADGPLAEALTAFEPVEHRLEPAGMVEGVRFINDSKGTNVDSVEKALKSFDRPIVLILGGRDKAGDFTALSSLVKERVTRIVALGECKAKVAAQLSTAAPVVEAQTLEEAVRGSFAASEKGGTVLFSPGCASFDMFKDYKDRGRQFKAQVQMLAESKSGRK